MSPLHYIRIYLISAGKLNCLQICLHHLIKMIVGFICEAAEKLILLVADIQSTESDTIKIQIYMYSSQLPVILYCIKFQHHVSINKTENGNGWIENELFLTLANCNFTPNQQTN